MQNFKIVGHATQNEMSWLQVNLHSRLWLTPKDDLFKTSSSNLLELHTKIISWLFKSFWTYTTMETTTKANNQKNYFCTSTTSTASIISDRSEQSSVDMKEQTWPMHQRTQAQKKMDRVLANRRSARRSRERKKQLEQNLQLSVAILSKRNEDLAQENDVLKQKLQGLSGLVNELTKQRLKTVASDKLMLTMLLQQMQPNTGLNATRAYIQNQALNRSSPAFLI